jgi:hypothetical protein
VQHDPVHETLSGELALRFTVRDPARLDAIIVHWVGEAPGAGEGAATVRRGEDGYAARLPATAVQPPAVNYWVVERAADGREVPVFASAAEPHRVRVFHDDEKRIEQERLDRRGGTRSSLIASGEYVDFGSRQLIAGGREVHDRYYRLEAGYAHAFLTVVEEVQISLVHVRGEAGKLRRNATTFAVEITEPEIGIDYGQAMLSLQVTEWARLRGTLLLGASGEGFEYGGGGGLVLGDPRGVNLAMLTEALTTLGYLSSLRMGFLALPHVPMGAAVEVSNFPAGDDSGVRLLYDIGYQFDNGSAVVMRGGYQSRTSVTGGPTAALTFRVAF